MAISTTNAEPRDTKLKGDGIDVLSSTSGVFHI
ncbi:MAG: hypothetical protein K0R30_1403 [Ornithinibacter sp.]|jgi:hypothetical protein|nr:hypothetical protein [Ornithinibacter sp.]